MKTEKLVGYFNHFAVDNFIIRSDLRLFLFDSIHFEINKENDYNISF